MKRKGILALALAVLCILALSSCKKACQHDWVKQSTTATCSKDGEAVYSCSKCDETKTESESAYGCHDDNDDDLCDDCGTRVADCVHKITTTPGSAATCTQDGWTESRYCSKCDTVLEEKTLLPALGHEIELRPAVPATCISEGLTEGKYCTRCNTVLLEQEKVPMTAHIGDEGQCTFCKEIFDHKLLLSSYIKKNGEKLTEGNRYAISKEAEEFGYTGLIHIIFDCDTGEFTFSADSTTIGIDSSVKMPLNFETNVHKAEMYIVYEGQECNASGIIQGETFKESRPRVEDFEFDNLVVFSMLESYFGKGFVEDYFGAGIARMIALCGEMIEETETGLTIAMFGFPKFD